MLGKLLKYETKATARIFLPLYAALLALTGIDSLLLHLNSNQTVMNIFTVISTVAYGFILVAIFVLTFFVMIQRFYKNLLGDEGYLMLTLPVKLSRHILSKLLISILWTVLSLLAATLSITLLAGGAAAFADFARIMSQGMSLLYQTFGAAGYWLIPEVIVAMFASLACSILMLYAAIAIGHQVSRHKLLASVGAYLALNMAPQIIASFGAMIPVAWNNIVSLPAFPHLVLTGVTLFNVVFGAAYWVIAQMILTRHLNLE